MKLKYYKRSAVIFASWIIPQVKRSGISTLPAHPSLTETIFMLILNHGYESLSKLQGIIPSAVRDNSAWQYDCAILVILEPH
jgi:hypothetical protein